MRFFAIAALILATWPASAQEDLRVFGADSEVPPDQMLKVYLLSQVKEQTEARRQAVEAIKTPEEFQERQEKTRERFIEAIGGLPEKTPLNARVVAKEERDGYRIEKVIYESQPNHHITATLYLPEGEPPYPGVLMPIGHSLTGKAAEYVQRGSILLAKNGLAVLAYDPIGQGERRQLLDEEGEPVFKSSTHEHTMTGIGALLVGRGAATYRIWDGIRSLDYLLSRPEIDPERIGCTGCSGGGTLTSYLMALDDRIDVAAPSCYLTTLERLFETIGPQDAEQNIPGQLAFGMDHADYITMRAPKPTLICAATRDFFDIEGTWTTFREAKQAYGLLGHGERIELVEYDTPHGFPKPQREAVARWMQRWLLGIDAETVEPDFPIAEEADLFCTETGQVLSAFGGKSVFDLNAERAVELERLRAERFTDRTVEELREEVRKRLALPSSIEEGLIEQEGKMLEQGESIERDGMTIHKWAITTEPGVKVPVLFFQPKIPAEGKPLVSVYVGADRDLAAPGGPISERLKAGEWVAMVDPRGLGETWPAPDKPNYVRPFGDDTDEAFLAMHLGRPLLGQRVFDLLQTLRAVEWVSFLFGGPEARENPVGFRLIGVGMGGPVALHAALFDDRIEAVELEGSLISWSAVARGTISQDQMSSVIPGVLEAYDLPDLAAALAPRPLTIRQALDPEGEPVSLEELEAAYARAGQSYQGAGAGENFKLSAAP